VYLLSEVGVSEFVMGALLAINPAAQMAFMYLFGRVADGWGRKPLIVAGMAGAGAHALVMATAVLPGTIPLRAAVAAGALFLLAAAFSAETTGTYAFIGDIAPTARESELMGLHSTARGFGGMAGPPLVGVVATVTTFETAFAAASLLAFGGTALVGWRLVESYRGPGAPATVAPED
jgi:MFS family permease